MAEHTRSRAWCAIAVYRGCDQVESLRAWGTVWYTQGCEPKTESRFFRSVFLVFSRPKTDFLKSVFRLPKKNETEKPTRFFRSFFFPWLFKVGFSVAPKTRNRQTDSVFFGRFFPPDLYANTAYIRICIETPSCMGSPLAPAASNSHQTSTAPVWRPFIYQVQQLVLWPRTPYVVYIGFNMDNLYIYRNYYGLLQCSIFYIGMSMAS